MSGSRLPAIEVVENWSILNVSEWLKKIGVDEAGVRVFQDRYVDGVKLLEMTENDLVLMPTLKIKQRKPILKYINEAKANLFKKSVKKKGGLFSGRTKKAPKALPDKSVIDNSFTCAPSEDNNHNEELDPGDDSFDEEEPLSPSSRLPAPLPDDDADGWYEAPDIVVEDKGTDSDASYEEPNDIQPEPVVNSKPMPSPRMVRRPPPLPEPQSTQPPPRPPKSTALNSTPIHSQVPPAKPARPPPKEPSDDSDDDEDYIAPDIVEEIQPKPALPAMPHKRPVPSTPTTRGHQQHAVPPIPSNRGHQPPAVNAVNKINRGVPSLPVRSEEPVIEDQDELYEPVDNPAQMSPPQTAPAVPPPAQNTDRNNVLPVKGANGGKQVSPGGGGIPLLPVKKTSTTDAPKISELSKSFSKKNNAAPKVNNAIKEHDKSDCAAEPKVPSGGGIAARIAALQLKAGGGPPILVQPKVISPPHNAKPKTFTPPEKPKPYIEEKPKPPSKPGYVRDKLPEPPTSVGKSPKGKLPEPPKANVAPPIASHSTPSLDTPPELPNRPRPDKKLLSPVGRSLPLPPTQTDAPMMDGLYQFPWYHSTIDRQTADQGLKSLNKEGGFLIRKSNKSPDTPFTLAVYFNDKVWNLHVRLRKDKTFALGKEKPNETTFTSVQELVEHHVVHDLLLSGSNGGITKLKQPWRG